MGGYSPWGRKESDTAEYTHTCTFQEERVKELRPSTQGRRIIRGRVPPSVSVCLWLLSAGGSLRGLQGMLVLTGEPRPWELG